MEKIISLHEKDIHIDFLVKNGYVELINFSTEVQKNSFVEHNPNKQNEDYNLMQPVEIKATGYNSPAETHGTKFSLSAPGYRLKYVSHDIKRNKEGQLLEIVQADEGTSLFVTTYYQTYRNNNTVRVWSTLVNNGQLAIGLEYVSSFSYIGIEKGGKLPEKDKCRLFIPHNAWQKELDWQQYTLDQLGMSNTQGRVRRSTNVVKIGNSGNWSTKQYLPIGIFENTETGTALYWQIESNGSWYWEIGDQDGELYLKAGGPNEQESSWWKKLEPGESFTTVKSAVGSVNGDYENALQELVKYRRLIRRPNQDDENLPVIFNDYMNSLYGDPTTSKELPMIDKAAEAGCEYYCIDCGWYADGYWWDGVGEWKESKKRFPNGLKQVTNYIHERGMVPGLWLELEVMGINSPLFKKLPQDWFFSRHGKIVFDRSRAQLDFRNPEVREYASSIVDRLISDYGIGYIKMDYNIDMGIGTDYEADSPGDGLLGHNRAYLSWLDGIFEKYPTLVIENCSSGGLRMDYAMLSRYSIQSTSDQEDFRYYATIASNAPSGVNSEQAAIWAYPMQNATSEEVIFNMVNGLLHRIHQSGHLANLSLENFNLVKDGISVYKNIRNDIKESIPLWPLGLSDYDSDWLSLAEMIPQKRTVYLAVWRRESSESTKSLFIKSLKGQSVNIKQIYPSKKQFECSFLWNKNTGNFTITLPELVSARLFKITY